MTGVASRSQIWARTEGSRGPGALRWAARGGQESGQEGEGKRAGDSADHRLPLREDKAARLHAARSLPTREGEPGAGGGDWRPARRIPTGLTGRQSPAQGRGRDTLGFSGRQDPSPYRMYFARTNYVAGRGLSLVGA